MSPVALRLLNKAWFKRCDPCQMDAYTAVCQCSWVFLIVAACCGGDAPVNTAGQLRDQQGG